MHWKERRSSTWRRPTTTSKTLQVQALARCPPSPGRVIEYE